MRYLLPVLIPALCWGAWRFTRWLDDLDRTDKAELWRRYRLTDDLPAERLSAIYEREYERFIRSREAA